jgi:lipoprotein-anchoring transpeptidase ErfK/SrfK
LVALPDETSAVADSSKPAPEPVASRAPDSNEESPTHRVPAVLSKPAPDPVRLFEQGRQQEAAGKTIYARSLYSEALRTETDPGRRSQIAARLLEIAQAATFGRQILAGDQMVTEYTVRGGDNLTAIARLYKTTPELLGRINGLADINAIRVGQRLKIVQGPFHTRIWKSNHEMFVYLQDTLVARFDVGLGEFGSTPTGEWEVKEKLVNPTYYPPDGGVVIAADDPENPLGERWLALRGTNGDATGAQAYGIHGTIEPESIGKDASLGCVRLLNEDVEFIYDLLVVKYSRVFIE